MLFLFRYIYLNYSLIAYHVWQKNDLLLKFDQNSKLYLRDEFNEDKINSINFDNYKVVSFASHALVVGEIDGLSEPSIVLSLPKKITDTFVRSK